MNAYLIGTRDGLCLVDCGTSLEPGWGALAHALAQARTRPEDVDVLICTHAHADHYGLAATVTERCRCELRMGAGPKVPTDPFRDPAVPLEARRALARREGVPEGTLDELVAGLTGGDGHHRRLEPVHPLADGAAVGGWRIVAAPGHSPTQILLFEPWRRLLVSADLTLPGVVPYLEHGYTDDPYAEHLAACDRALILRPALLLPGHHHPLSDAGAHLAASRDAATRRLEQLKGLLGHRPRTAYELAIRLAGQAATLPLRQQSLSTTLCGLLHLERAGQAVAVERDGVRRYTAG